MKFCIHFSLFFAHQLEQTVAEYKTKITEQRETIASLLRTIEEKREDVDAMLESSVDKALALKDSQLKKWSDSQETR